MSKDRPQLRFSFFENRWEKIVLHEYKEIRDGTHESPKYHNRGYPLVTSKNLKEYGLDMSEVSLISEEDFTSINKRSKVDYGDILFGMIGTIGNPVIVYRDDFAIKNVALLKNGGRVDNIFLIQLLKSNVFDRYIRLENAGGTQKFLSLSKIRNFEIFIPGDIEQQQIGLFFKKIDDLINVSQRELKLLQETKKAFMQKLFPKDGNEVPDLRFKGFVDSWELYEIGKLGNTFTGLSGKSKEDFGHGDAKFITYMNVFSNPISDFSGTEQVEIDDKQNQVKYGDVFFTTSSETPGEVGMSSVWLDNTENIYLNSFCFGYRPTKEIYPYYMAFMLRSPVIRKKFTFLAQGISRYNISKNKVMKIEIPIPEKAEQEKIGDILKDLDSLITLHQRQLDSYKELKKGFLQKMFV